MPPDKEAAIVRFGESYKSLQNTEGWKNLLKWVEVQIQALTNSMISTPADKFSEREHFKSVGKIAMVQLMIIHIQDTIK